MAAADRTQCWLNGEPATGIDALDRGLAYGHGLFETVRIANGVAPLLDYHLQRLEKGLQVLSIPLDLVALKQHFMDFLAGRGEKGVVKIMVTAGVGGRGYQTPDCVQPNTLLLWYPLPPMLTQTAPLRLRVCQHRLPLHPPLAGLKHLNRLDQVLARREWQDADIHEGLLLDVEGRVIEATASNLFALHNGVWVTPTLERCGVAGVMRELLLKELLPGLSLPVEQRDMGVDELAEAEELFLCNSLYGICPVGSVDDLADFASVKQAGHLQVALQERYPCYRC
ncbi:aminodeoxychorismate lyase [bacterium SCSIO 12696]|nr:aminodeoxychorismate lyase [bacterium SCSIO 12696]